MKRNGLTLKGNRYSTEAIIDADDVDDLALLPNTPDQAESPLYHLEQTTRGIVLFMNSDKTEFIFFKQDGTHIKWKAPEKNRRVHLPLSQYFIN